MNDSREDAVQRWRRKAHPLPVQRARLEFGRSFSGEEWRRVAHGLLPGGMEDKWFVYSADRVVRFVRSWTGYCIYEIETATNTSGERIVSAAWANRNADEYSGSDDAYDTVLLQFLIDNLLLGQRRPFPVPRGEKPSPDPGSGLFQHHIAGTGYPEIQYPWTA